MVDIHRHTIRHSVVDVIHILEETPVKGAIVPQVTVVELMNRASIAHLSIERALKFLITTAGGPLIEKHDLGEQYRELQQYDSRSANFLEEAFKAAIQHYRYNPNSTDMRHLRSLERYLTVTGSRQTFRDIRYWELNQSLSDVPLHQVNLSLHTELLHALSEILLAPDRLMEKVQDRVEREVREAMFSTVELGYSPGTPKGNSVQSYIDWIRGFSTWSEALNDAVQKGFELGDQLMGALTKNAYRALLASKDSAVRYFANTLDVLPQQSRELVPCVEWFGQMKNLSGVVKSPAGTILGWIERGPDSLWYITSHLGGDGGVYAKARTQTDARCYLAQLLARQARVLIKNLPKTLTVVNEGHYFFQQNYDAYDRDRGVTREDVTWTHRITFWEKSHGIANGTDIRVEVNREDKNNVVDILEGRATEISDHEVRILGSYFIDFDGDLTIRSR